MNLRTLMVASVMATGVACSAASAQSAGMYVLHAKASGSCPAMDWHIALDPSATVNNVKGMIGWDDMKHIARVVGFVNPDTRYFVMEATEVGGDKRTAKSMASFGWMVGSRPTSPGKVSSAQVSPFPTTCRHLAAQAKPVQQAVVRGGPGTTAYRHPIPPYAIDPAMARLATRVVVVNLSQPTPPSS